MDSPCENQTIEGSTYYGFLFGFEYMSDFDLSKALSDEIVKKNEKLLLEITDLMSLIEQTDLSVSVGVFKDGGITLSSELAYNIVSRKCHECSALYLRTSLDGYEKGHPYNNCSYGIIEEVLTT